MSRNSGSSRRASALLQRRVYGVRAARGASISPPTARRGLPYSWEQCLAYIGERIWPCLARLGCAGCNGHCVWWKTHAKSRRRGPGEARKLAITALAVRESGLMQSISRKFDSPRRHVWVFMFAGSERDGDSVALNAVDVTSSWIGRRLCARREDVTDSDLRSGTFLAADPLPRVMALLAEESEVTAALESGVDIANCRLERLVVLGFPAQEAAADWPALRLKHCTGPAI